MKNKDGFDGGELLTIEQQKELRLRKLTTEKSAANDKAKVVKKQTKKAKVSAPKKATSK